MRAAPCLTLLLATPISAFLKPVAPESAMGDLIATMFMPIIGVLLSNGLYFSGLPAVYRAQKTGTLGDLNVLPLAIMSLSTTSWLAYALSVPNIFIVLSNLPGVIVAMSYTVLTLPLIKTAPERRQVQFVMIAGATVIPILWCIIIFARLDNARRSFTLGAFASFLCIILFASPLSTISEVISSRNSVSIYAPLTAAQARRVHAPFLTAERLQPAS
jgi:solute carrier family 50 protein (sugar transporter)